MVLGALLQRRSSRWLTGSSRPVFERTTFGSHSELVSSLPFSKDRVRILVDEAERIREIARVRPLERSELRIGQRGEIDLDHCSRLARTGCAPDGIRVTEKYRSMHH